MNPLRIDSVSVRSPASDEARPDEAKSVGCVLAVRVLDQNQPVRITEAEVLPREIIARALFFQPPIAHLNAPPQVVRVRKRHRGFGGGIASALSSFVKGGNP